MEDHARKMARVILRCGVAVSSIMASCKKNFNSNGKNELPISESQFRILLLIKHMDIHTIVEMHAVTGVSESTLSILFSKLSGGGYLYMERPKGNGDGRKKYFYLTESGEEMLLRARQMLLADFAGMYDRLSPGKKVYLYQSIKKLLGVFDSLNTVNSISIHDMEAGCNEKN